MGLSAETRSTTRTTPDDSQVVFRSLGGVDLRTHDGTVLSAVLAQPKRLALLAYLVLAGPQTVHRRDSLLTIFWPELDQSRARAALRQALHFLRQALGADVLVNRGSEEISVVRDRIRCDVVDFSTALSRGDRAAAVEHYRGPFLDGLHVSETPEFERWVDRERERHARAYARALETLANDAQGRGETGHAAECLRALVEHEPYRADITIRLMEVLARSGDRAAALGLARSYVGRMTADLDLDPDPSVLELAERLRRMPQPSPPAVVHAGVPSSSAGEHQAAGSETASPDTIRANHPRRVAAVVFALVIVPIIWMLIPQSPPPASGEGVRASVGIMPFEYRGDSAGDYLAQGLSRAVVRSLRDLRGLRALGPEDTRGLVSDEGFERRTADELNVQFVLRTTMTPSSGDRVQIVPVLIRTASDDTVWADTLYADREDLPTVHGDLAVHLADVMGAELLPSERRRLSTPATVNPEAYDLYLRGNQRLRSAVTRRDELLAAVDLLQRAVERDSTFALAYSQLAIAHLSLYWWHRDRTPARLAAAKAAADAVMGLRPDLPDAHLAMGWYHYWGRLDYDRALNHFEMARATRSPNSDLMILLGAMRRRQGDWAGSTGLYEQALADNPACAWCAMDLGYSRLVLGRYAAASDALRQATSLSPDFFYGQVFGGLLEIAWRGDTARARTWIRLESFGANELVQVGTRHWGILGRVLGRPYDDALSRTALTPAVDDTADYYLARAQLLTRRSQRRIAAAYYDSAAVWLERHVVARSGDARTHALLGLAYAGLGRAEPAITMGQRAVELLPPSRDAMDGPLWMIRLAEIYVMLGRFDRAVDMLEQVVATPSWVTPALLRVDPLWRPLWGHERFEHLASSP